jgi:hypothetical protein
MVSLSGRRSALTALALLTLAGCADSAGPDPLSLEVPAATPVEVPAGPGASLPHVASADAGAILSWVEPSDSAHVLRFARWSGTGWTEPVTIARGTDWFVNWADFPSVVELGDDDLAAHWLQRSAASTYAYDVMIARSVDGGVTWSEPVRPHTDGTPTEHGFVSLFPQADGLGVVWLDGRNFAEGGEAPPTNEMTVRFAVLDGAGATGVQGEAVLDGRACDCCQTAVALTTRGPLIAYRDRTEAEVRDVAVTRLLDGAWTEPRVVHADDWVIDACPVNGPQADARGDDVVIAWFTAANDSPRVHVAFSDDAGGTFAAPIRVDAGDPLGRVDVLLLDDGRALVLWLERGAESGAVTARIVARDGRAGEPVSIASTLAQRPSGFPRMARYGDGVLLAWTQPGDPSSIRAATLDIGSPR